MTSWKTRPEDEQFPTLEVMHDATKLRAEQSLVETVPCGGINFAMDLQEGDDMLLNIPVSRMFGGDPVTPTHWAYGQLSERAKLPVKFTRGETHPQIIAAAFNWGLQVKHASDRTKLMVRNGELRAATGPDYGRIYDHELVSMVANVLPDGWKPAHDYNGPALYSSDRNTFMFWISKEHNIQIVDAHGHMRNYQRGFFAWNSEVGQRSIGFKGFLFDGYCQNRNIWNITAETAQKVVHTKNARLRFEREIVPLINAYVNSSPQQEQRVLQAAKDMEIRNPAEWLKNKGFNAGNVKSIITQAQADNYGAEPHNLLDVVNAGTAYARTFKNTDTRLEFETDVSKLLNIAKRSVEAENVFHTVTA